MTQRLRDRPHVGFGMAIPSRFRYDIATPQALADTFRRRLHAAASDTSGYVTPSVAGKVGVPAVELRKLAARGGLTLALVDPRKIRIGTHRRVRRRLPEHIEVVQDRLPDDDRTVYEGVPSATVARTIIDSVGKVTPERLADALEAARAEGYIRRDEMQRALEAISSPP